MNPDDSLSDEEIRIYAKRLILSLNERARNDEDFSQLWYEESPYIEVLSQEALLRASLIWLIQEG